MFTQEKQVTPSRECPPRCPEGVLRLDSDGEAAALQKNEARVEGDEQVAWRVECGWS